MPRAVFTSKAYSTSSVMEAEVSMYRMLCRLANSMASVLSTSLLSSRSSLFPRMIVTGSRLQWSSSSKSQSWSLVKEFLSVRSKTRTAP